MELDLRFKQYEIDNQILSKKDDLDNNEDSQNKPHQKFKRFIKENNRTFNYEEISKICSTIQENTSFTLEDGTKILISKTEGLINIAIEYPNKSKFIGSWTNIKEQKEYFEKIKNTTSI